MKFFKKIDLIIIAVLIVVSISGFFAYKIMFSEAPALAEIFYESKLVKTIDLSKNED